MLDQQCIISLFADLTSARPSYLKKPHYIHPYPSLLIQWIRYSLILRQAGDVLQAHKQSLPKAYCEPGSMYRCHFCIILVALNKKRE